MDKKITFRMNSDDDKVLIMQDGKQVGHIFSPASSGNDTINAIQVCGFTEAYDLWGCGIFDGKKDIQLLFDDFTVASDKKPQYTMGDFGCVRCYMKKCVCDNPKGLPFNVKREKDIQHRLIIKEKEFDKPVAK